VVKRARPMAILAVATVILAACNSAGGAPSSAKTTAGGTQVAAPGSTAVVAQTTASSAPRAKIPLARTLKQGMKGDDVGYLQQRLKDLHFDPGPVDGRFGTSVTVALWAYQALTGTPLKQADGQLTPDLWSKMQDPFVVTPKDPQAGDHTEVDLVTQTLIVWKGGKPALITHISSGSGQNWCEQGWCGTAVTPSGVYQFDRRWTGWRQSILGYLYNPVYFNYGIAVHGAPIVPLLPASHGCIRIPMHISEYFPTLVNKGDPIFVYDGVKPPAQYGSPPPPANTKDPTWTGDTVPTDPNAIPTTTVIIDLPTTTKKPPATTTTAPPAPTTTLPPTSST
jgi:hypothetical protein